MHPRRTSRARSTATREAVAPGPHTSPPAPWFVYLLRCADDSLYTGVARDVNARFAAHVAGRGARYTRSRGPLALCAVRRCLTKGQALSLEYAIKQLSKADKEALLAPRRLGAFARRHARS